MAKKNSGGKATKNNVNGRRKAVFDKSNATLVRVTFAEAGISALPSSLEGRCWIEWEPRLDATGPDKRCFYSKVGEGEWNEILGESGTKLARNGASLNPKGRAFLVLFPGTLKIWREAPQKIAGTTAGHVESFPATVNSAAVVQNAMIAAAGGGYAETMAASSRAPSAQSHRPSGVSSGRH